MPTAFVTGGTGFIGSRLVARLVAEGVRVRALARSAKKARTLAAAGAEPLSGDLADPGALRSGMDGADVAFHLAAWYQFGVRDRAGIFRVNVEGTRHVLNAARETALPRLVYCSTMGVLGNTHGKTAAEDHYDPSVHATLYTHTKYLAQQEVDRASVEGLPVVSVLPGSVYGPNDRSLVGTLLSHYAGGRLRALVYPDSTVSYVFVDDVAEGFVAAWRKGRPGQRYLLVSDVLTLRDTFRLLERMTGIPGPRIELPGWVMKPLLPLQVFLGPLIGQGPYVLREAMATMEGITLSYSGEKARRELEWKPRSLEAGLRETLSGRGVGPSR